MISFFSVYRYKKEKKDQQPVKQIDVDNNKVDEVENNCTPPKKKKPMKNNEKCKSPKKNSPETPVQWSNWRFSSSPAMECFKSPREESFEARLELPKKRWLREARMEQNIDTCRSLNQTRPTVLMRAGACSTPLSPPWTPEQGQVSTSTPKVAWTPEPSRVSISTPKVPWTPELGPVSTSTPKVPWTPEPSPVSTSTPKVPVIVPHITDLLTPPDSAHKSQVNQADLSFTWSSRGEEILACPLPCDEEVLPNHPLNLSQTASSTTYL